MILAEVSWDPPSLSLAEIGILVTITAAAFGAFAWIIKAVVGVRHEVKPNSGLSMADAVHRIEGALEAHRLDMRTEISTLRSDVGGIRDDVQAVHGRVTEHLKWHLDHTEGRAHTRSADKEQ